MSTLDHIQRSESGRAPVRQNVKHDSRAFKVAEAVYEAVKPDMVILFGSRARGNYSDSTSDIDILVVSGQAQPGPVKERAMSVARQSAGSLYNHDVPVQLLWRTADEFQWMRRTVNNVVARAAAEGIVMPEDAGNHGNEDNDYAYEWTVTDLRVRHAEDHLATFELLVNQGMSDRVIGKNAQEAMEHALKAIISAYKVPCELTHDLNRLLRQVNDTAPDFQFSPRSDYNVLGQYSGREDYYDPEEPLTNSGTYYEDVVSDVRTLLCQVSKLRQERDRE